MQDQIRIIEQAILSFQDSGRTSSTALARVIIGELKQQGFEIVKETECDNCTPTPDFYLGMTCPKCQKPFRVVKSKNTEL